MKNLLLPSGFDRSILDGPKQEMMALAIAKAEMVSEDGRFDSGEIEVCAGAECWDDCFTGWLRGDGVVVLLLQFNVGRFTHAVKMEIPTEHTEVAA